jgi:phosphate-selective porin
VASAFVTLSLVVAGCGGSAASSAAPAASASVAASAADSCTLDAPASVAAGADIEITWTGAIADDYITIGARGATSHDDTLPYADIADGNPAKLKAPATAGEYDILCVQGDTVSQIKGRRPLTVT